VTRTEDLPRELPEALHVHLLEIGHGFDSQNPS
jgi:hypothetical protein